MNIYVSFSHQFLRKIIFNILLYGVVTADGRKVLKTSSYERIEEWLNRKKKSAFSKKMLYKKLPVLSWLPK